MAYGDVMIIRDDPKILLKRLSTYVEPIPAKMLARKGGCSEDTAEKWREGVSWPNARHWLHLISSFGTDITEAVFHPDRAVTRLSEEVAALEDELAAKRTALRVVADGGGSTPLGRPQAPAEGRAFTPRG